MSNLNSVLSGQFRQIDGTANAINNTIEGVLSNLGFEGKSAYEVACDNGFVGTEEEWLKALVAKIKFEDNIVWYKYDYEDQWHVLFDMALVVKKYMKYIGQVKSYSQLPTTDVTNGYVYKVLERDDDHGIRAGDCVVCYAHDEKNLPIWHNLSGIENVITDAQIDKYWGDEADAGTNEYLLNDVGLKHLIQLVKSDLEKKVEKEEGKQLISTELLQKLDGIQTGAEKNTVTGIKGDAEQEYRVGEVNLTPEDLGAAAKTYVDENLEEKQNKLTFDKSPTASSTNPVTSEGIKTYVDSSHYTSKAVVNSTATSTDPTTSAIENGNVYLNLIEDGKVRSATKISGSGTVTVTADDSGNIVVDSPAITNDQIDAIWDKY